MLEEEPENDVLGSHGADLLLTTIMIPLKTRLLSSLVLVLFSVGVEARTWTSADGSKTFEGEHVTLKTLAMGDEKFGYIVDAAVESQAARQADDGR